MSESQPAEAASATIPTDIAETQPFSAAETAEEVSDEISIEIVYHPQKEPLRVPFVKGDLVNSLRTLLADIPETCYLFAYEFALNGKALNDFHPLPEEAYVAGTKLIVQTKPYDDATARLHIRRIREIMNPTGNEISTQVGRSSLTDVINAEAYLESSKPEEFDLKKLVFPAAATTPPPSCLTSLLFSSWNPPSGNRVLQGDLFYLDLTILEGPHYCVTASTEGFFVNSTKGSSFNPQKNDQFPLAQTLVQLLEAVSKRFKRSFTTCLEQYMSRVNENFQPLLPTPPWIQSEPSFTADPARAEMAMLATRESTEMHGALRDWNEDFQAAYTLPTETVQEQIWRETALFRINQDFVNVATQGAIAIVKGSVTPLNPDEPEDSHLFLFHNIFYSKAKDSRGVWAAVGGDRAARMVSNQERHAVRAYFKARVPGLHILPTCIVDYAGRRLLAQTVIPGIFQNPTITDIIYGSNTEGEIKDNEAFHELVSTAATVLSIAPSKVVGKDGAVHTLATSAHVKGLIGADGRSYLLEHVRTTPIDVMAPEAIREVSCYRRELLNNYIRSENLRRQQEAIQAAAQGPIAKMQAQADGKPADDKPAEEKPATSENGKTETESEEKKEPEMVEFEYQAFRPHFDLNANSQKFKLAGTEEEIAEVHKTVDVLGKFMLDSIPRLIEEDIVDGKSLREVMHQHGVNMRYLGIVAALAKSVNLRVYLCAISEVITRSAKSLFNQIMEKQPQARWAITIAAFLNLLLFPWQKGDNNETALNRNGSSLWNEIKATAKERFQIELQDDAIKQLTPVTILRSFCQKNGIVLRSSKFNFHQHPTFTPGHILELLPKVKHMEPDSEVGSDGVNVALQLLRAGRKDEAYIAFTESANVIIHVCGSLTAELAFCWRYCASIALDFGNTQAATEFEARGLVVWEKLYGLDYHRAALNYYNLATQLHSKPDAPDNETALNLASRSLYIQKLNGGTLHPYWGPTLELIGSILAAKGDRAKGLAYLTRSLEFLSRDAMGAIRQAKTLHRIALVHSENGDHHEAANLERQVFRTYKDLLGEKNKLATESNYWVLEFTKKAVDKIKGQSAPAAAAKGATRSQLTSAAKSMPKGKGVFRRGGKR